MRSAYVIVVLAAAAAHSASGCGAPDMHPGAACGSCHAEGGDGPRLGAAGTVYSSASADDGIEDANVLVVDAEGRSESMVSHASGNFFTKTALVPPLQVTVTKGSDSVSMPDAPSGNCNSCHTRKSAPSPGRVHP